MGTPPTRGSALETTAAAICTGWRVTYNMAARAVAYQMVYLQVLLRDSPEVSSASLDVLSLLARRSVIWKLFFCLVRGWVEEGPLLLRGGNPALPCGLYER